VLQFMRLQRVGHGLATEQQVTSLKTSRKVLAISSLYHLELSRSQLRATCKCMRAFLVITVGGATGI